MSEPEAKPLRITKAVMMASGAVTPPGPDNYRCQQCQLFNKTSAPFSDYPPEGPREATVIISTSPLASDDMFWYDVRHSLFADTGLDDENTVFLNPTLCTPYDRHVTAQQLRLCQPFIDNSLSELQPKRVMAMGANAVKQIAGDKATIKSLIGTELNWRGVPASVTYDPTMALGDKPETLVSIHNHIMRMVHGLKRKLPDFPGWRKPK